jgi:ABC-type ATPase involved in cell division
LATVVREEAKRGATVILSTHDPALVAELDGQTWLLERGQLARTPSTDRDQSVQAP